MQRQHDGPLASQTRLPLTCLPLRQAEAISRAKRQDASLGLPGVVTLYELPGGAADSDTARFRAILDGQHRVGALRLLSRGSAAVATDGNAPPSPWERVLVEVYPLQSERSAEALFTEINSAQPVMLVDLPPSAGGAPAADKSALEGAAAALAGAWRGVGACSCGACADAARMHAARFPAMFKPSAACKAPHCNIDTLRDKLFQVRCVHSACQQRITTDAAAAQLDVMAAHGLTSAAELQAWCVARLCLQFCPP